MTQPSLLTPILADQRDALIRAEILAGAQRAKLEAAVIQVITECGVTVDEASEASGLRPAEIYALLKAAKPLSNGDLAPFDGMR